MYLFYLFAWKFIGILPEKIAYALASFVADFVFKKNSKGVSVLEVIIKELNPKSQIKS